MKMAIHAAKEALLQYPDNPAVATDFCDKDLSIFISEVEKAKGPGRIIRLLRFYQSHYNSNAQHKAQIADYFFRNALGQIIQGLEDHNANDY